MQTLLKELLPEPLIRPLRKMAEQANGLCYARTTWRVVRQPKERLSLLYQYETSLRKSIFVSKTSRLANSSSLCPTISESCTRAGRSPNSSARLLQTLSKELV